MKISRRTFLRDSARAVTGAVAGNIAAGAVGSAAAPAIIPFDVLGRSSPSNLINVAMIGCGRQTASVNIPQLLESKNARIAAVCDVDSWRLASAQKQINDHYAAAKGTSYNGCAAFGDYREVLSQAGIDAVMVATPDHWHIPMAIDAARAGKHISLEKPLGTCVDHGRKLVAALKEHRVITRNDSEFRTLPKFSRAVELVRNGRIGKIRRIFVGVPPESNGSALPPTPTMPVPSELNYDFWLGPAWDAPYTENRAHPVKAWGRPGWMRVDSYCNGMISNWGAHLMGIAQWGNATEYTGPFSVEGTGVFDKGLWNTLNSFEIRYQYAGGVEMSFKIERPFVRFEGEKDWIEIEYPDKLTASSQAILDSEIAPTEIRIRDLPSDKEDFLLAVKSGKPTLEPLETAHRTISMCQLGLISIKTGSKLIWNPETEEIVGDNAASAMLTVPIREKYCRL
jgi:myo-inositol 2-dehydrogenase / D-chiro-inositol 1-dehydrogenase